MRAAEKKSDTEQRTSYELPGSDDIEVFVKKNKKRKRAETSVVGKKIKTWRKYVHLSSN
jgi:hypothetical protein